MAPKYREVFPNERADLERLLGSGNEEAIMEALVSAAFYDPEWKWVQTTCLRFLDHPDKRVRCSAATCLGHVARIHRRLDIEIIVPRLIALSGDPSIRPHAETALDDINHFIVRPQ